MDAFAAFEATFPGQSCRQSLILRDHKGEIVPGYFQEFPRTDVHRCSPCFFPIQMEDLEEQLAELKRQVEAAKQRTAKLGP